MTPRAARASEMALSRSSFSATTAVTSISETGLNPARSNRSDAARTLAAAGWSVSSAMSSKTCNARGAHAIKRRRAASRTWGAPPP